MAITVAPATVTGGHCYASSKDRWWGSLSAADSPRAGGHKRRQRVTGVRVRDYPITPDKLDRPTARVLRETRGYLPAARVGTATTSPTMLSKARLNQMIE